jgi:hypothetical protein
MAASKPKSKAKAATKPIAKAEPSRSMKPVKKVPLKTKAADKHSFAVGDKVTHKLFGPGKILGLRDDKLSIQFGKHVTKEILIDYVSSA